MRHLALHDASALPGHAALERDVLAARTGDREAFGRLVEATQSTVCAIAFAIVRDVDASQDVAQDVFLSAWKGLGKLRNPASFLPWLRQTARFRARSWRRGGAGAGGPETRHPNPAVDPDAVLERLIAPGLDPQGEMLDREQADAVRAALDDLPEDSREVVTLYYREGRSVRQVATLLDLSEAAVRQRLSRARKRLRADVLERLGAMLAATAPGLAFTGTVVAGLAAAAPPVGAAMVATQAASALAGPTAQATAAKTATAQGASTLGGKLLLSGLGGAAAGALFGVGGVVLGLRGLLANPFDAQEERTLRRFRRHAVLATLGTCALLVLAGLLESEALAIGAFLGFAVFLGERYQRRLPRILERRHAHERATDPDAARRQQRQRWISWIGWIAGVLSGGLGLYLGLTS